MTADVVRIPVVPLHQVIATVEARRGAVPALYVGAAREGYTGELSKECHLGNADAPVHVTAWYDHGELDSGTVLFRGIDIADTLDAADWKSIAQQFYAAWPALLQDLRHENALDQYRARGLM